MLVMILGLNPCYVYICSAVALLLNQCCKRRQNTAPPLDPEGYRHGSFVIFQDKCGETTFPERQINVLHYQQTTVLQYIKVNFALFISTDVKNRCTFYNFQWALNNNCFADFFFFLKKNHLAPYLNIFKFFKQSLEWTVLNHKKDLSTKMWLETDSCLTLK